MQTRGSTYIDGTNNGSIGRSRWNEPSRLDVAATPRGGSTRYVGSRAVDVSRWPDTR